MGIVILATLFRIPVLGHLHGGYFGEFYRTSGPILRFLIRVTMARFAGVIVLTEKLRDMFTGLVPSDHIYVVENFVPDEVRPTESELARRWRRLKQNPEQVRLLYLSNLIPSKGYLDVIHAIRELRSRGINALCDLAGAWLSDDDRVVAEELVRDYDLQGSVSFRGVVRGQEKRRLLESADIFVLPTYYRFEGVPLSILEAMAWGLPVIVTNHGGIRDVVRDRVNGVFVRPRMPGDIADAVCWLISDMSRYHSIGVANARLVMERFTESKSAQSLVNVISALVR